MIAAPTRMGEATSAVVAFHLCTRVRVRCAYLPPPPAGCPAGCCPAAPPPPAGRGRAAPGPGRRSGQLPRWWTGATCCCTWIVPGAQAPGTGKPRTQRPTSTALRKVTPMATTTRTCFIYRKDTPVWVVVRRRLSPRHPLYMNGRIGGNNRRRAPQLVVQTPVATGTPACLPGNELTPSEIPAAAGFIDSTRTDEPPGLADRKWLSLRCCGAPLACCNCGVPTWNVVSQADAWADRRVHTDDRRLPLTFNLLLELLWQQFAILLAPSC